MDSNPRIYLAPFQGITTYTYREVYTKYFGGIAKLFTPFYPGGNSTKGLSKRAVELNFTHQNGVEVVPQILSKDADEIVRFANFCDEKGYNEINWNLGCPYARVANKKRGSGILPYPAMIDEILKDVMHQISINLSIKCRLGYFSEEEIFTLMDVYNSHNLNEVTIHARLGKQLYTGEVNVEAFEKAMNMSKIPIVYNGDIFSEKNYHTKKKELDSINLWMIGRGLLVDPFLPMKIIGTDVPDIDDQKLIAYKFITDLYLKYRKKNNDRLQAISVMKELWGFMSYSFDNPQKIFNKIKKTTSFDEYEEVVARTFEDYNWVGSEGGLFMWKGHI